MESIGGITETPTESISRSNRRIRNKVVTSKLCDSKGQENVNNVSSERSRIDNDVKEEVPKSSTTDAKVNGSSSNLNSSTPRRRKDPLANLHSNLSPKYIGYTTPPNQLNSSSEERTRSLRKRNNNSSAIADTLEDKEKEDDIVFTPNNESTVGFVRRTPRNREPQITPDKCTKRKDFVSPIDKLLIKNGAVMENNNHLPLADSNEALCKEGEVVYSKNKVEGGEMELGVDFFDIYNENKENVSISSENCDVATENGEDDISISTEIEREQNEDEDEIEVEIKDDVSLDGNDDTSQNKSEINENELSNDIEGNLDELVDVLSQPDKNVENSLSEECLELDAAEIVTDIQKSGIPSSEDKTEVKRTGNYVDEEDALPAEADITDEPFLRENFENKNETINSVLSNNESDKESHETAEANKEVLVKIELESVENGSNNEFTVDNSVTVNSPSAISMDSAKGSSIVNEGSWMPFSTGDLYWGQIYNYCYWPCMVCPDPIGKTISTEEVGRSGDHTVFVHVRFFADNGRRNWVKRDNLMPYVGIESYQERTVEVREKYGAKSAKYRLYVPSKRKEQVWFDAVYEANMVAEVAYVNRLEKFFEIFEKSKAFHKLEKQRRKSMYISVNSRNSDIEKLFGSNDNMAVAGVLNQKRERSISPYSPAYSPIKPLSSKRRKLSGDKEELATTSSKGAIAIKSEDNSNNRDLNLSQTNFYSSNANSLVDLENLNSLEFRKFFAVMKDYVMEHNHNEKLEKSLVVAVRNIWALKQINRRQLERKLLRESLTPSDNISPALALVNARSTGEGSVKRLSSRLKTLMVRKSLMSEQTHEFTPKRSVTPKPLTKDTENLKTPLNRPILEVIDDIFELDTKYLFKGMSRDPVCKYCFKPGGNLKRCAKNCTYWLHNDCLYIDFNKKEKRGNKSMNVTKSNSDSLNSSHKSLNGTKPSNGFLNNSHSSSVVSLTEVGITSQGTGESDALVICKECASNEPAKCMVCNCSESKSENDPLVKCCMAHCERSFHPSCCKYWPQAKITISKNHIETFRCPSHVCHTCVSDDPKEKFQHLSNAKLTKCVKCPATFHTDSTCIPAGSQILTAAHIICPRHSSTNHDMTVNVNWCFICVGGGQLTCCETCPTAVHAHCLNIPIAANEGYICEECESGRMPLYGEMVWAKFTNFRWWPAIILPPTEIPKNIARKTHNPSDFVVRFFGTHDHGWISRRRVYLYLEGDSSEPPKTKSYLDLSYNKGVKEAKEVYEIIKAKKLQARSSNDNKGKLHPQPYVRIKANRAVPPVRLHVDIESVSKCECDPREENPCGPDTNCLNRVLYHECNSKLCPAGERCQNQMFESRISPRLEVIYMKERGFGLVCREPIKAGNFVIEYVGEIINDDEFQARMQQKSRDREENFYFLSVEKDYIIDAGPKGNLARFMNHSCDPNCETQKWSVNSLNRVGLFAIKDIAENTELTFNYHWDDLLGNEKKTCYCGAKKCAGQIGGKIKDLEIVKEPTVIPGISKTKSKPKIKPNKKLPNGNLKNKLDSKMKARKTKNMRTTKKMAAAANSARLETNANKKSTTKSKTVKKKKKEKESVKASTSRLLESPDIFS